MGEVMLGAGFRGAIWNTQFSVTEPKIDVENI